MLDIRKQTNATHACPVDGLAMILSSTSVVHGLPLPQSRSQPQTCIVIQSLNVSTLNWRWKTPPTAYPHWLAMVYRQKGTASWRANFSSSRMRNQVNSWHTLLKAEISPIRRPSSVQPEHYRRLASAAHITAPRQQVAATVTQGMLAVTESRMAIRCDTCQAVRNKMCNIFTATPRCVWSTEQ